MTKSVCIFAGSSPNVDETYFKFAKDVGALLAQKKLTLLYSGGCTGLARECALGALQNQGHVKGIIAKNILRFDGLLEGLSDIIFTDTLNDRKLSLINHADVCLLLPGGTGSLDEFFGTLALKKVELHHKPIIILNAFSYWQPLLDLLEHMKISGFETRIYHETLNTLEDFSLFLDSYFS